VSDRLLKRLALAALALTLIGTGFGVWRCRRGPEAEPENRKPVPRTFEDVPLDLDDRLSPPPLPEPPRPMPPPQ
jgi:hypothetical protein